MSGYFLIPIALLFSLLLSQNVRAEGKWIPKDHIARSMAYWDKSPCKQQSIELRLCDPPAELIDYLRKDNVNQGFTAVPKPMIIDEAFRKDFKKAVAEMPKKVRLMMAPVLLGVFPVKDLDGSAYNEKVSDSEGKNPKFVIVIDAEYLNHKANEWASLKESNPFKSAKTVVEIEEEKSNDRAHAIQFILLHEFGHAIGAVNQVHPDWSRPENSDQDPSHYSFSKIGWRLSQKGDRLTIVDETVYPLRPDVQFYRGQNTKLPDDKKTEVYTQLRKTELVSLYAGTNMLDDFAETFAHYVHEKILKKPFRVDGKDFSCVKTKPYSKRVQFVEDLLK